MLLLSLLLATTIGNAPLTNTKPLELQGDIAAQMVAGIDRYLDRESKAAFEKRRSFWMLDTRPLQKGGSDHIERQRERLKKLLGMIDERKKFDDIEFVGGPQNPSLLADTTLYKVYAIRWTVFDGVDGEGLLLEPKGKVAGQVVAIPDADMTPEMFVGLAPGIARELQVPRRLAELGCRVIVPTLINRQFEHSGNARLNRWTNLPHREFIYRMSYEMGRHLIGYEVQKVLAAVDWLHAKEKLPIVTVGYGDGATIAAFATACDQRIAGTCSLSLFGLGRDEWQGPIDRNVWAYQAEIGNDGLGKLIAPRGLFITLGEPRHWDAPTNKPGRSGAAPGRIRPTTLENEQQDFTAIRKTYQSLPKGRERFAYWKDNSKLQHTAEAINALLASAGIALPSPLPASPDLPAQAGSFAEKRQQRQFEQLVVFTQKAWRESEAGRLARFAKADFSSPEKYTKSIEPIRQFFWEEVIGKLPKSTLPMNPRTRLIDETPKWKSYEVVLDLDADVFAYGILMLPKDIKEGEKRPVVVCQHGLEGRPQDITNSKEKTKYYNSFGAPLAERGYIVFAPQNPYIGKDNFRVLQRKANPLKLSLFSFIVRQHERILEYLATLPQVDASKMAFYGLSYGGKTAMRVPAILPQYCLSICSGDFNEWIGKNVSVDYRGSYMFTFEYEMPEFDLGTTFNYAEMAYLIAPRPFMVERGHDDGVGSDEMVSYEFAKVRYWYENKLKLPGRTEIEYFVGGHEIHGVGTFEFLKKHLK